MLRIVSAALRSATTRKRTMAICLLLASACASANDVGAAGLRDPLTQEERARIAVVRRVCPSIAHVEVLDVRWNAAGTSAVEVPNGMGSGVIWDRAGHVVTNAHVIRDAGEARVVLKDGSSWRARVMGSDRERDVAVLMIDAPADRLVPADARSRFEPQVGQTVLALGNPFGLDHTLTVGVISALGRDLRTESGAIVRGAIQTDAAINPGSSGGALIDTRGRLIGINTALVSPSGAFAGIAFAIPVAEVDLAVGRILGALRATRPGLGIRVAEDAWARDLGLEGVLILDVLPDGPGAEAGLRGTTSGAEGELELGDVIRALDGAPVRSRGELRRALDAHHDGDVVALELARRGTPAAATVRVTLERH